MKSIVTVLILLNVSAKTVLTRKEFMDWTWRLAEARFGHIKSTPVACPEQFKTAYQKKTSKQLEEPCYELKASMRTIDEYVDKEAGFQPQMSVFGLLYYGVGRNTYDRFMSKDYQSVRVVTSGDPQCRFSHPKLKELSSAVVGPSEVEITNTMVNEIEKAFGVDGSMTVALEPIEGVTVGVTVGGSYRQDALDSASSAVGNVFKPGKQELCVPTSVLVSRVCRNLPRMTYIEDSSSGLGPQKRILYGGPGGRFMPLTNAYNHLFEPIFACVSEFNIQPDDDDI